MAAHCGAPRGQDVAKPRPVEAVDMHEEPSCWKPQWGECWEGPGASLKGSEAWKGDC